MVRITNFWVHLFWYPIKFIIIHVNTINKYYVYVVNLEGARNKANKAQSITDLSSANENNNENDLKRGLKQKPLGNKSSTLYQELPSPPYFKNSMLF